MTNDKQKKKIKYIDAWDVNQISVAKVAQDWNQVIFKKGRGTYYMYCPNPKHQDHILGNCVITDNGVKNCFHCFSCGAAGGPINLVMLLDNCDFVEAKNKLAQKYNLVKYKYVSEEDLPKKWLGLSQEEYDLFGLQNVVIKIPYTVNDKGETLYNYDRYSLRELAKEDPEMHDEILIGKFAEKIDSIAKVMALLDCGYFHQYAEEGFEFCYDKNWEDACISLMKKYCRLLKKGLINKTKLSDVFSKIPDYLNENDAENINELIEEDESVIRSKKIMAKVRKKIKNAILTKQKQKSIV